MESLLGPFLLKAWNILVAAAALSLLLVALGIVYQRIGSARSARRFPPPGELVRVGRHRLHLHCQGEASPTVVFDSALGSSSLSWVLVQPEVAKFTATCSYDRAGCGWSEAGPFPRTVEQIVKELHTLLLEAGVPRPYLLVGHSYGGFTMRLYAARHPQDVAGLILLDAADPQQWSELSDVDREKVEKGARLSRRGAWVARLGLARLVILLGSAGATGLARQAASFLSTGMPRPVQDPLLSPVDRLSPEVRSILKWFWTQPAFYKALASQIEGVPESASQVAATGPYGDLPLVVISAQNRDTGWTRRQQAMARLSRNGEHIAATQSGHWIPLDRPRLVVETIRQMVHTLRRGHPQGFGDT